MSLRHHGILIVHSIACAFASFAVSVRAFGVALMDYGERWLESAVSIVADPRPALALVREGWADLPLAGSPLDSALLNGLRHESRIARRGAHRHI